MCGRFTILYTWREIHAMLSLTTGVDFSPRYNMAPLQFAPVVRQFENDRSLSMLRWGLVPFFSKDDSIAAKTINARSETAATQPAFRAAFKQRRCIVPASGFYEWQPLGDSSKKQPFYIKPAHDPVFLFAGLWESWNHPVGGELLTFTVLTTSANDTMTPVHNRMPVMIDAADVAAWLTGPPEAAAELMRPAPEDRLILSPVGTHVNNVRNDDAACLQPPPPPVQPGLFG